MRFLFALISAASATSADRDMCSEAEHLKLVVEMPDVIDYCSDWITGAEIKACLRVLATEVSESCFDCYADSLSSQGQDLHECRDICNQGIEARCQECTDSIVSTVELQCTQ